ncbi:lycopene cyclase [Hymenobacter gummosus]|uniref:Lycopene cyclase n=1 Tax=Hymenobacter gummosus TaxID=1776032 RepID=A0A431U8T2_9BACT|nr:lycopene cyclase family protein [Hymenobacter gummosus]RTQ53734.1 lycopene cyclase [Hymenobacter gummosus]
MEHYDIIIAGGGMAGLSLAFYLSRSPLRSRSILLVDRERKEKNDRTWCYWERGDGPFEAIVYRKWRAIDFYGTSFSGSLDLGDYQYKMLRGIDFYRFMHEELQKLPNLDVRFGEITHLEDLEQGGMVVVGGKPIVAPVVFDSTYRLPQSTPRTHNLLQHFKGWVITTERDCFDPNRPRVMDFRVEQQEDCRFLYVLPFNKRQALVEYTIFNEQVLASEAYEDSLRQYIDRFLEAGSYRIEETEFGIIPMSDVAVSENPSQHIVRIGTSGGYTKPSTGYTFQRTQRYLQELVASMETTNQVPVRKQPGFPKWFKQALDSVLLNVLQNKRHPADDVFTKLFQRNPPERVFRFMDEDTSFLEDLQIVNSMPKGPFAMAVFDLIRQRALHL